MMHMEREIGQLSPGTSGDITILKMVNIPVDFYDTKKNKRQGSNLLLPVGTVASGMLVYEEPLLLARQAMN
jgi:predicted amidohydrolase